MPVTGFKFIIILKHILLTANNFLIMKALMVLNIMFKEH